MKSYVITGKLKVNGKKGVLTEQAVSKGEIWSNPEDFGFVKIFKVEESRGIQRFNKRDMGE